MDKIEKIRQEIGRLKKENDNIKCNSNKAYCQGYGDAFVDLLPFLDTLSEEPDKSLEEEIQNQIYNHFFDLNGIAIAGTTTFASVEDMVYIARHFAEWQKKQMLKNAVEGYVNYYEDSGGILMAEAQVGCPYHNGDKVRIIVLKEEEE